MKLRAAQPAALEAIPEQDRIHLPGRLIDSPNAVAFYDFTRRVEGQAVELGESVDLIPVLADTESGFLAWSCSSAILVLFCSFLVDRFAVAIQYKV